MRIMPGKTISSLTSSIICASLFGALAFAQTSHNAASAHAVPPHATAAHTSTAGGGCITIPNVLKVPAVPPGSPCPKALFTVAVTPPATVTYASPLEPGIAKAFGLEPTSFTLGYIDTRIGTGELAQPNKYYTVKYTGYLPDGTVFDATSKHPEMPSGISFQVGGHHVIPGWDTGFAGMHVGGKRRLFIPYQLAYGAQGKPPVIPPQTDLIFDMELVSQSDTDPTPKPMNIQGGIQGGTGNDPRVVRAVPPPASSAPATAPADRLLPSGAAAPATAPAAPANTPPPTPPATENK